MNTNKMCSGFYSEREGGPYLNWRHTPYTEEEHRLFHLKRIFCMIKPD